MLKILNRSLLLAPLLLGTFSLYAQPINFEQAWSIVKAKNNSIAAQRANVDHYQKLEEASQSLNYPAVTLGANYTRLDDDVTISGEQLLGSEAVDALSGFGLDIGNSTVSEKDILNSSITALWAIYTGGKITAAHNFAAAKSEEADAKLAMETQSRYEDLSRFYYTVVLAQSVLDTRRAVEQGLTKHRDFSVKLEQQGQIPKVERLQADASLAKAVVERKKAEMDLEIARSALTEILNQKVEVIPESDLFINSSLPPLSAFTEQTLVSYPGLGVLTAKQNQAKSAIKAEQSKYLPQVFLYGNYTLYEDDTLTSEITPDWFVGVGVSIALFDNSGRSEKVQAAQSSVLQVRYLYQQAIQDLTVLVKKTYFEAQQAIEEAQGLEASLALADENLKLRAKAFNQGLSTSVDVVDAEMFLANIKIQQQVAKFNYVIALNKLLSLSSQMSTFNQYETTAI
ncbi:TolC family protein [Psychromonas algicola]|uniref:TolC family protein n=1 Tax=Psychromonas algicola TaxID=2555642 RepID=UPI00106761F7|nr:TolC family protein [Psychromonas sp. RZ5]TEW51522.1 TolC family protein [Psychromonas sp. RZ5]